MKAIKNINTEIRIAEMIERLQKESKKGVTEKQIQSIIKDGNTITTNEGEIVNIRVYSDGWTKLTGPNLHEQFPTEVEAYNFLKPYLK